MASKQAQPEYDLTDVLTLLRMANGNTVRELQELHHYKRDSPISGDAIWCYTHAGEVVEKLAETPKVCNNEGMDIIFSTSANTVFSTKLGREVPVSIEVTFIDTVFWGTQFTFDSEIGAYLDEEGNALTIEWDGDKLLVVDVPESM